MAYAKEYKEGAPIQPHRFRFEPLVEACYRSGPDFRLDNVDILSGLNNLRQILKFVSGTDRQPFRIDIQMVGKTMMMTRWERDLSNIARTSLCRGYGRGFEKACTQAEKKTPASTSHHRIVSYVLGDINIVAQFEADLRDCTCQSAQENRGTPTVPSQAIWAQALARMQIRCADQSASTLHVADIGVFHTRDCLLEVKSRDHKNNNTDDIMAQMWLSSCHNLYLARHVRGRFDISGVQHKNVRKDLSLWQDQHQQDIAALHSILHTIRHAIQDDRESQSEKKYALVVDRECGKSVLKLWRRNGGQEMLPIHLIERFGHTEGLDVEHH